MFSNFSLPIKATVGVALTVGTIGLVIQNDRQERDLILGGHCSAVTEMLYAPPPIVTTTCSGNPTTCTSSVYQSSPYFRTLWRCNDPEREDKTTEFWRRTRDDEVGK